MKVRLYYDIENVGKAKQIVDVAEEIGNRLLSRGECAVIAHDPPKNPVSNFVARPSEVASGNAE